MFITIQFKLLSICWIISNVLITEEVFERNRGIGGKVGEVEDKGVAEPVEVTHKGFLLIILN